MSGRVFDVAQGFGDTALPGVPYEEPYTQSRCSAHEPAASGSPTAMRALAAQLLTARGTCRPSCAPR
jgi:hypothetical protein